MKDRVEIIINGKRYVVTDDETFQFTVEDDKVLRIGYDGCGVSVSVRKAEV